MLEDNPLKTPPVCLLIEFVGGLDSRMKGFFLKQEFSKFSLFCKYVPFILSPVNYVVCNTSCFKYEQFLRQNIGLGCFATTKQHAKDYPEILYVKRSSAKF